MQRHDDDGPGKYGNDAYVGKARPGSSTAMQSTHATAVNNFSAYHVCVLSIGTDLK